jgi:hypothetical protein
VSRESLVAALEEAWDFGPYLNGVVAGNADLLLPILLAHASPEGRAAALRGLLEEQLNTIADRDGYVYLGTLNSGARRLSKVHRVMELLLAPTTPTGGTAE